MGEGPSHTGARAGKMFEPQKFPNRLTDRRLVQLTDFNKSIIFSKGIDLCLVSCEEIGTDFVQSFGGTTEASRSFKRFCFLVVLESVTKYTTSLQFLV